MHATRGSASSSASASAPFSNNAKLCKSNQCVTKIDPCSLPEVSFCRPVYLQPRYGVLATKESLLRLWCDLGARRLLYGAAQLGRARRPVRPITAPLQRGAAGRLPGQRLWLLLLRQGSPVSKMISPSESSPSGARSCVRIAALPPNSILHAHLKRRYLRGGAMRAIFFQGSFSHPSTGHK